MDKYEITKRIENLAPPETAEPWDCPGWLVETKKRDISRIMLALTVTDDIIRQAKEKTCQMIISHHPLFYVPLEYKEIDLYCAHTNLDLAYGGTTDTLIENLSLCPSGSDGFLRYVDIDICIDDFIKKLREISPNMRYVNNKNTQMLHKIAFCAGSGSEFIEEAFQNGADAIVTGDLKFHTALESPIAVFDIGHFESEIQVLKVFAKLINKDAEIIFADEKSPFIY